MDLNNLIEEIISNTVLNITFSNPFKKSNEYNKVNIQASEDGYLISRYTSTQVFHENINSLKSLMSELFSEYKQLDGKVKNGNYNIRVNKKGSVLRKFSEEDNSGLVLKHNRSKNYLLSNYENLQVLKDLRIVSQNNTIINSMSDKFRQINKYIELVDDLIKNDNLDKLKIVDFGSGKSYLTFILYEYLSNTLKLDVEMIGIDLKADVIEDNRKLAIKYGYNNLKFICGDINDVEISDVDMMISLHACDIATDLALNKALEWKVKYIVSVPCCQNELYTQLKSDTYSKMLDFKIIKERMSALLTDTVRANVLQYKGYQTQVIEYIDSSHSLKNLMIRARFTGKSDDLALENIRSLQKEYNFTQKLLELQKIK